MAVALPQRNDGLLHGDVPRAAAWCVEQCILGTDRALHVVSDEPRTLLAERRTESLTVLAKQRTFSEHQVQSMTILAPARLWSRCLSSVVTGWPSLPERQTASRTSSAEKTTMPARPA